MLPTLPLGAHRLPMHADADLTMQGMAGILRDFIAGLDLSEITLVMNDWGGPQLLLGGEGSERIARTALCACEAFDNVPPKGSAQGRRDLVAAAECLRSFEGPALVAWASEDRLMPREHGRRLAELLPDGQLLEIGDCYTLIPEDQPALLASHIRELMRR